MPRTMMSLPMMRHTLFTLALSVVITGCSLFSCSGNEHTRTPKDTIVVGWGSEVLSFDPRYSVDANAQYVEHLLHCSLLSFNPDGSPVAELAEELPRWLSPTQLEVKIKDQARFTDNTPVTAEDVKATYEYFISDKGASISPRADAFSKLAKIEQIDARTLHFILKEPDASFITNLVIGIIPVPQAEGPRLTEGTDVIGCGPFRVQNAEITNLQLEENPNYSLGNPPKTPKLTFKVVKDEKTLFAKLKKGDIDLVQNNLNPEVLQDVGRKLPYLMMQQRPALRTTYIGFNFKDRIASNPAVRQAIAHALNREEIIQYVLAGMATPAVSMLTSQDTYLKHGLVNPEFDLEKASRILDDAGLSLPKGASYRFTLNYQTTTDITRINIARAIGNQLKKIGIRLNVSTMNWGPFKDEMERGGMQLWGLSWIGFKDPDIFRYALATTSAPPNGANRGWFSNKHLDELLEQGRTTTDVEQRRSIYAQVEDIIAEELPYIFLWHEDNFVVHHKDVKGFKLYADGRFSALTETYKE